MNFLNKLLGKKPPPVGVYIAYKRTPEQEEMYQEQLRIRDKLGFERDNDTQNWLRMHQILLDYEQRLKHLESGDGHTNNKG